MPFESPFPPLDIPNIDLWSFVFERKNKLFPEDKDIFTDGDTGRSYTFAQLRDISVQFGKGLKGAWKWKKGDVLAFYTPNHIDVPPAVFGLLWAGGIGCPVNPLYTVDELVHLLRDSGSKALACQKASLPIALQAAEKVGIPEDRIILLGDARDESGTHQHFTDIKASPFSFGYSKTKVDPQKDLAFLVYSSGTTGLPKGVCLSHYNIVANVLQVADNDGRHLHCNGGYDNKGDKQLGVTPFFHIYGLTCCVVGCSYNGYQIIVMSRFDIEKACRLIQDYRISFIYVPPPIVLALAKHPAVEKYDLTSLRVLNSGAAPLTRELTEALWDRHSIPVKQGYGLSETSPTTHVQSPDDWKKFIGSVGKLVNNMEARIVDLDGNDVPDGEEGELWVKGPNIFQGYLNQPDKTRDTMSADGFLKTGDIFRRDAHDNYYCVDRLKELIKYKGFQVPPAELEGYLLGHADVSDVCVIGVQDDERATEVPRAYVVLRQGAEAGEAKAREIAEWMAGKVAPHKRLRGGVVFIDEVPKSPSGKILRRVMRDRVRQESRQAGAKL